MPLLKLLCVVGALLSCYLSLGQSDLPEFGVFTSDEQNLKTCDFDKEADAVIFFDVAQAGYNDNYNLVQTRRVRFKILKEKGIERGNIQIPYYKKDEFEFLGKISAIVHTTDETGKTVVKELKRSEIFNQKINDRISVVKFALPNIKVGSIIEYTYESTCKHYGGLQDWTFQSEIPTMLSRFDLVIVPNTEFSYLVHKSDDLPIDIKNNKTDGSVKFQMNNIAGLRDEPYMDAPKDYIQRVEFQLAAYSMNGSKTNYITSWNDVSKQLMGESYFGKAIDKKFSGSDEIIVQISAEPTAEAKAKFVHDYVRKGFSWNGLNTKYAEDGLKSVWEKRKGNSGEINLLLINLLKTAGLDVYPLLVSERDHGKINKKFPMLDQFNKVVAYVNVNGNHLILDATDEHTPMHLIPFDILNTTAFIVNTKKGGIIELKDDTRSHKNKIELTAMVNEDGIITGNTIVNSSDYARVERVKEVKASKEKFGNKYFVRSNNEIRVDSLEVLNTDADTLALNQQFKFSTPLTSSGDYRLLNLNWFSGFDKNPFISDNRFSDINFGSRYTTDIHEKFEIPASLKPDALPKNVHLVLPDRSMVFTRVVIKKDNFIDVQLSFSINRSFFNADEYPALKEYYKKLNEFLNEPIVLNSSK